MEVVEVCKTQALLCDVGVKEWLKANQDEVGLLMTCMRGLIRFNATTRLLTNTSFLGKPNIRAVRITTCGLTTSTLQEKLSPKAEPPVLRENYAAAVWVIHSAVLDVSGERR